MFDGISYMQLQYTMTRGTVVLGLLTLPPRALVTVVRSKRWTCLSCSLIPADDTSPHKRSWRRMQCLLTCHIDVRYALQSASRQQTTTDLERPLWHGSQRGVEWTVRAVVGARHKCRTHIVLYS